MLLITTYSVIRSSSQPNIKLPFEIELDPNVHASIYKDGKNLLLALKRKIQAAKLEIVTGDDYFRQLPDGSHQPLPRLRIRDDTASESVLSQDLISAVSFLTNQSLDIRRQLRGDHFEPENGSDRALLKKLGSTEAYAEISGQVSMRTFEASATPERVSDLLPRRVGLRIYAAALKSSFKVAQFRELWRVLESAFGRRGKQLIQLLAAYPPVIELDFDKPELEKLLSLRGRASHADSRSGLNELILVERLCSASLPRLNNLVERVIATKKSWGKPTLSVHEVLGLNGFIGPDVEEG